MKKITRLLTVSLIMLWGFQNVHAQVDDPPTTFAPSPSLDAGEVVSIFSDAYTNAVGITSVDEGEILSIAVGDDAVKITDGFDGWTYINLDQAVDIDSKEFIHIDFYVISPFTGKVRFNGSSGYVLPSAFVEGWNSFDI